MQSTPHPELGEAPPTAGSFVPRMLFGRYIRHLLKEQIRHADKDGRLELVRGDVLRMDASNSRLALELDRDRRFVADATVLAIGNFPPEPPPVADPGFYDSALYRADPWAPDALTDLDPAAPVLLIGTGLTMVDTVVSLLDQGHTGPIHALSRRGLLPHRHNGSGQPPPNEPSSYPTVLSDLVRLMRREITRNRRPRRHLASGDRRPSPHHDGAVADGVGGGQGALRAASAPMVGYPSPSHRRLRLRADRRGRGSAANS